MVKIRIVHAKPPTTPTTTPRALPDTLPTTPAGPPQLLSTDYLPILSSPTPVAPKAKKQKTTAAKTGKGKKQVVRKGYNGWQDIPQWEQDDHSCYFFSMPPEILDKIFSSPILVLRDHTSLAATCRAIRAAYYSPANSKGTAAASPLWRALMVNRQPTTLSFEPECLNENKSEDGSKAQLLLLERIWSGGLKGRTSEKDMEVLKRVEIKEGGKGTGTFQSSAIRSDEWDQAIGIVAYSRVTKTEAKSIYKINDKQLYTVTHEERRNPHHKHGAPMQLFNEAAVESVALKLHGGAFAHAELLRKRQATADKAAATRLRNGTTNRGGGGGRSYRFNDYYD